MDRWIKESFAVIGKEGATLDGEGFIQRLWDDANAHFGEVQHLARRDETGNLAGIWGAMSDLTRSFQPWEDQFSRGLYLAGVECGDDAEAPAGWTKWVVPGYEYICVAADGETTFSDALASLRADGLTLAGAAHDFTCPKTGKSYMLFPIRTL